MGVISFLAGSNVSRIRFLMPIGGVSKKDIDCVIGIFESVLLAISKDS